MTTDIIIVMNGNSVFTCTGCVKLSTIIKKEHGTTLHCTFCTYIIIISFLYTIFYQVSISELFWTPAVAGTFL